MAENKKLEREYVIPLRKAWLRVPQYERTGKAVKEIKKFIAKHMKVTDRNVDNVKLDVYFNNELWFKGRANPPSRIKVRAVKEGDIVKVEFAEIPEYVKFLKAKHGKLLERVSPAEEKKTEVKPEHHDHTHPGEKTEEQKKDEKEKEIATAELHVKEAEMEMKAKEHIPKIDKHKTHPRRMALDK